MKQPCVYTHTHTVASSYIKPKLYQTLVVTTNQKSIIDVHTKKKKKEKRPAKTNPGGGPKMAEE